MVIPSVLENAATASPPFARALAAHSSGDLAEARRLYLELMDTPPLLAVTLHQLGVLATQRGELETARDLLRIAVRLDPAQALFAHNLSAVYDRLGRRAEALDALGDSALALHRAGALTDAIAVQRQILERDATRPQDWFNHGGSLLDDNAPVPAVAAIMTGLALFGSRDPRIEPAFTALAEEMVAAGVLDPRVLAADRPQGKPIRHLDVVLTNLGNALTALGRLDDAILWHRLALALDPAQPMTHFNLSLALLARGDWAEGWAEYEWRWRWDGFNEPRRTLPCPRWDGGDVSGKTVFAYTEQGWGDAIQFLSMLSYLRTARQIVLEVPIPLLTLCRSNFANTNVVVVARQPDPDRVDWDGPLDCAVPLMCVPAILGLTEANLPAARNYIAADPPRLARWRAKLTARPGLRVGLVWAGSPTHPNDRNRSIALEQLAPLFSLPGIAWYSLQVGPRAADLARMNTPVVDLSPDLDDFIETAAAVAALDVVVTVDTAVAHLAGACGTPNWILIPFCCDWRWLRDRTDSPWYPQARLFRQHRFGDWDATIAELGAALRRQASERT